MSDLPISWTYGRLEDLAAIEFARRRIKLE